MKGLIQAAGTEERSVLPENTLRKKLVSLQRQQEKQTGPGFRRVS